MAEQRRSFGEWVRHVYHEGMVRRFIVRKGDRNIVDLPLLVAIVGAAIAPWLAAIGLIVAVLTSYELHVEQPPAEPGDAEDGDMPAEPPPATPLDPDATVVPPADPDAPGESGPDALS